MSSWSLGKLCGCTSAAESEAVKEAEKQQGAAYKKGGAPTRGASGVVYVKEARQSLSAAAGASAERVRVVAVTIASGSATNSPPPHHLALPSPTVLGSSGSSHPSPLSAGSAGPESGRSRLVSTATPLSPASSAPSPLAAPAQVHLAEVDAAALPTTSRHFSALPAQPGPAGKSFFSLRYFNERAAAAPAAAAAGGVFGRAIAPGPAVDSAVLGLTASMQGLQIASEVATYNIQNLWPKELLSIVVENEDPQILTVVPAADNAGQAPHIRDLIELAASYVPRSIGSSAFAVTADELRDVVVQNKRLTRLHISMEYLACRDLALLQEALHLEVLYLEDSRPSKLLPFVGGSSGNSGQLSQELFSVLEGARKLQRLFINQTALPARMYALARDRAHSQVHRLFSKLMESVPSLSYVACNLGEVFAQERLKRAEREQRAIHNWTLQLLRENALDDEGSAICVHDPRKLTKVRVVEGEVVSDGAPSAAAEAPKASKISQARALSSDESEAIQLAPDDDSDDEELLRYITADEKVAILKAMGWESDE